MNVSKKFVLLTLVFSIQSTFTAVGDDFKCSAGNGHYGHGELTYKLEINSTGHFDYSIGNRRPPFEFIVLASVQLIAPPERKSFAGNDWGMVSAQCDDETLVLTHEEITGELFDIFPLEDDEVLLRAVSRYRKATLEGESGLELTQLLTIKNLKSGATHVLENIEFEEDYR